MRLLRLLSPAALVLTLAAAPVGAQTSLTAGDRAALPAADSQRGGGVVVTQSASTAVDVGGVSCANNDTGFTTENQYWRVFPLAEQNLSAPFTPTEVQMGIVPSVVNSDVETTVNIYRMRGGVNLGGTFARTTLTLVATAEYTVGAADVDGVYAVAITGSETFAETDTLAVEWSVPDGTAAEDNFNIRFGANDAGQTGPVYLSTDTSCGGITPTNAGNLGNFANLHWALSVVDAGTVAAEAGPEGAVVSIGAAQPNPVADLSRVPFSLEASAEVRLAAYDVMGREVAVLAEGPYAAGAHTATFDTRELAAGTYVLRLATERAVVTRTLSVVR